MEALVKLFGRTTGVAVRRDKSPESSVSPAVLFLRAAGLHDRRHSSQD